jgi:hypothetical protein
MLMSAALLKEHTTNNGQEGQKAMANLNAELTDLKTKIQLAKQLPHNKPVKPITDLITERQTVIPKKGLSRWSNDEFQMAIKVVRRYGRDFQAMADIVGKSVPQCRNFFMNNRKKYNLDQVCEEYRSECEKRDAFSSSVTEDSIKDDNKEVDDIADQVTREKHAVMGEMSQMQEPPELELMAKDMEDGHRDVIAIKLEPEGQPDSIDDEGLLPLDTTRDNQVKSSKWGDTSRRTADKANSKSKKR